MFMYLEAATSLQPKLFFATELRLDLRFGRQAASSDHPVPSIFTFNNLRFYLPPSTLSVTIRPLTNRRLCPVTSHVFVPWDQRARLVTLVQSCSVIAPSWHRLTPQLSNGISTRFESPPPPPPSSHNQRGRVDHTLVHAGGCHLMDASAKVPLPTSGTSRGQTPHRRP